MIDASRPLAVATALGPGALRAVALEGREELSQLFRFTLDVVAEKGTPVPFEALLGEPVVIRLAPPRTEPRFFAGICSRVSQGPRDSTRTSLRLELVPRLWLSTRTANLRAFGDLAAPELLERVLAGLDPSFELRRSYPPRGSCVQYRESDFDFASRLMEEEGIWYLFRHGAEGHELVVADSPESHPELPAVQFDARAAPDTVFAWQKQQELTAGKVTLRDFSFELPEPVVEGEATVPESARVGGVEHVLALPAVQKLELYDFPGAYADRFDGIDDAGRAAATRMEAAVAASLTASGESTVPRLTAGHRFTLEGHGDADGRYVLTAVSHSVRLPDLRSGRISYSNSFTCIPDSVPFRPPRRAPRPVVGGVQTAVVVEGPDADPFARVRVRFPWDREGSTSPWIRVAQPHSSSSTAHWLPEVGDEVLVAFEHGDPDRPYVIGRLFNASDPPPERGEASE